MKALMHLQKYPELKYLMKSFSLTHIKTTNQPPTLQKK